MSQKLAAGSCFSYKNHSHSGDLRGELAPNPKILISFDIYNIKFKPRQLGLYNFLNPPLSTYCVGRSQTPSHMCMYVYPAGFLSLDQSWLRDGENAKAVGLDNCIGLDSSDR